VRTIAAYERSTWSSKRRLRASRTSRPAWSSSQARGERRHGIGSPGQRRFHHFRCAQSRLDHRRARGLSKAKILVFRHKDVAHAEEQLASGKRRSRQEAADQRWRLLHGWRHRPAARPLRRCGKIRRLMMVDDAHASGVLGRNGRGTVDHFNVARPRRYPGREHCRKPIGALGDTSAARRDLIDFLYHRARPFLFSTSHPPSVAATCIAAFRCSGERTRAHGETLGEHALLEKRTRLAPASTSEAAPLPASETPITPSSSATAN